MRTELPVPSLYPIVASDLWSEVMSSRAHCMILTLIPVALSFLGMGLYIFQSFQALRSDCKLRNSTPQRVTSLPLSKST
jgi:hypothetical protein